MLRLVAHAANLLASRGHTVEHAEIAALRDPDWVARFLTIWAVGVICCCAPPAQLEAAQPFAHRATRR